MTKTKKILIVTVVVSMMLAVFSVMVNDNLKVDALSETTDGKTLLNQYSSLPIDPAGFASGGVDVDANIPYLGSDAVVYWHFIDSTGHTFTAYVKFENAAHDVLDATLVVFKDTNGATHYGVYTPKGYKLVDAYLNGEIEGNFNLSHTYVPQDETTIVETTPEETTQPSDETVTETTIMETTTVEETTQPSGETVTETTIELTTESIPLNSETTEPSQETITETTTIIITTEDIPKTGETGNGNGLLIGLVLLVMAAGLTVVVYRGKMIKN